MTKDTAEVSQFTDSVACREYTLPRDEESSQPKGWIQRFLLQLNFLFLQVFQAARKVEPVHSGTSTKSLEGDSVADTSEIV